MSCSLAVLGSCVCCGLMAARWCSVLTCSWAHGAKADGCQNPPQAAGSWHIQHHKHQPSHHVDASEPHPSKFSHCLCACLHSGVCVHGCMYNTLPSCAGCQPGRQPYLNRAPNITVAELEVGHLLVQVWSPSDVWWLWKVRCKMAQNCHFHPPHFGPPTLIFTNPARQGPCPFSTHCSKSSP